MKTVLHRGLGIGVDQLLCGTLALLHHRHARRVCTRAALERYVSECEAKTRAEYFAMPAPMEDARREGEDTLSWTSRAISLAEFPVNARACANLYRIRPEAPTVIILHALTSVSDVGYVRLARHFNSLGWNAAFLHLPFHYSRRPRGHINGELCCTADLILNADTVRQAVVEVRQLMSWLRAEGSTGFGILGTSYGGWVGALVASLEADLRFLALLTPMVNISHALYEGPSSWTIRRQLLRAGLDRSFVDRHAHLSSPRHAEPGGDASSRTVIVGGLYDRIVRLDDLEALRDAWLGSELVLLPQGHYGHGIIPRAMTWLNTRGLLDQADSANETMSLAAR